MNANKHGTTRKQIVQFDSTNFVNIIKEVKAYV